MEKDNGIDTAFALKSCPFCGARAQYKVRYSDRINAYFVTVKCMNCSAQSQSIMTETNPVNEHWGTAACRYAADAWNKRTGAADGADQD